MVRGLRSKQCPINAVVEDVDFVGIGTMRDKEFFQCATADDDGARLAEHGKNLTTTGPVGEVAVGVAAGDGDDKRDAEIAGDAGDAASVGVGPVDKDDIERTEPGDERASGKRVEQGVERAAKLGKVELFRVMHKQSGDFLGGRKWRTERQPCDGCDHTDLAQLRKVANLMEVENASRRFVGVGEEVRDEENVQTVKIPGLSGMDRRLNVRRLG